jgi:hypothetical protein
MNDDHIERRGLAGARLDHALEFGPAIIRSGSAWLDVGLNQLVAARCAVSFALPLLIGNRDIVLGLPRRRDGRYTAARNGTVIAIVLSDHRCGPNSSSKRSPNHASNTSSSASVTGTGLGQSSVTSHVSRSCLGGRPVRGQGSGSM